MNEKVEENSEMNDSEAQKEKFQRIVEAAEKLYPLFLEEERRELSRAVDLLTGKIIPLLSHECPLLVAITGGGSVGKSTLFNALAGGKYSGVKAKAGYTRRTLAAIHPSIAKDNARMELLFELFKKNAVPVPIGSSDEMLAPGDPLYVESTAIPAKIAVLDTPDFDTGTREGFANRDAAEEILVASDILVYLFTNQTYNNKANTDFVRKALSGIGRRKVILVYRCSAAYPDDEVWEHIDEVLRNLFPESANPRAEVLGCYRSDETDAVVRGERGPEFRPLDGGKDLMGLITSLDVAETRKDSIRSQCDSILGKVDEALRIADDRRRELVAYRDGVKSLASYTALEGLKNFPQGLLMAQFAECWKASQPVFVRWAHWPGEKLSQGVEWLRETFKGDKKSQAPMTAEQQAAEYKKKFLEDFRDSVGKLRSDLSLPMLHVEVSPALDETRELCDALKALAASNPKAYGYAPIGREKAACSVSRPALLESVIENAIRAISSTGNDGWIEKAAQIASLNDDLKKDINDLVCATRKGMSAWERSREMLWAAVATLPPIAAVTWTLCTSDPVVGTGAIAHLGGLFGLGDLWATIAIPASLGLDAANKALLKKGLEGLYGKWFERKRKPISDLIDENVTTPAISDCSRLLECTQAPLARLRDAAGKFESLRV